MILAAGLGTRLQPLSDHLAKPALPVRGIPMIAYALRWLAEHGVREVAVNLHHLPETVRDAALDWCPEGVTLHFSHEQHLLDTGGGIKRVHEFLAESDPSIVLAGDMLFDFDLEREIELHLSRGRRATLLLRRDPRAGTFGSIGIDRKGTIRRIATRFDLGGECDEGLYMSVNLFSPTVFDSMPLRERFSHLDDWLAPELEGGADDLCARVLPAEESVWEPVGTLAEYLRANLEPLPLRYWPGDGPARQRGTTFSSKDELVLGGGAQIGRDVTLRHAVVWGGEAVPDGFRGTHGVFAGGRFIEVDAG